MAGQARISGLNYDAVLGSEDYRANRQIIESEIITRFKMAAGFPGQDPQFGILDVADPSKITSSESSRPLLVRVSTQNALAVSVNPGYAIAPNGSLLYIGSFQEIVSLATSPSSGKTYVVILQASLNTAGGTTQLNDYQVSQSSQELIETQITSVEYTTDFVPAETQVVLAIVKVVDKTGGGQELQIDQTTNTYSFVRPWFSIIDVQHRARLGSGTVTDRNPHATSINDLTIPGTVGIFQGLSGQGIIISRDRRRNKMTGAGICNDTIAFSQIKTDTTGEITKGSIYNKLNAQYAELTRFPVRLGSVYEVTTPANAISAEILPGTNIIVFGPNETFNSTQTFVAQYTSCSALEPQAVVTSNFLTFGQPTTDEVVVSGGFTYPSLQDPNFSFEGSGPFARRYMLYLLPSGVLSSFPQILVPPQSALTSIGSITNPIFPARLSVGLTNTTGSSSLEVTVTITGTAAYETGAVTSGTVTETLVFKPANGYVDQVVPSTSYDLDGQLLYTTNKFSAITAISVSASNAGTSPQVQVWAEIEPGMTPEINDAAPIALVKWNGNAVSGLNDRRRIQRSWVTERQHLGTVGESELDAIRLFNHVKGNTQLSNPSLRLFTEDFEDLKNFDSTLGFAAPTTASGVLTLNSSISLLPDDTITLTGSKILTAVASSPTTGQFEVGALAGSLAIQTIRDNIINAINDSAWASNITATASTSNPLNINLVLNTPVGVAANAIAISATVASAGAISVSGFNFALDGFGECYIDRQSFGLDSPVVPSNLLANPYQYAYRRRYRSRAVSLPATTSAQTTFLVQIHGEDKAATDQVRIRGSKGTNPGVWEAWSVMSAVSAGVKGLYYVTFSDAMHKIQVEYYGKARGLTAYMARS